MIVYEVNLSIDAAIYPEYRAWLDAHGFPRDEARRRWLLDNDIELNCQGIEVWLDRK